MQQVLATGGMGLVYAARHDVTGRAVAVKLLRPELVTRADLVDRVRQEARIAVEAAHANVVEVLDAGADDNGMPYLVLERLYGQPLDALLHQPLSLECTLQALLPVCNALAALHELGIIHRDLKPSNIFLSREEGGRVVPKLLDFGIAKAMAGGGNGKGNGATLTGSGLGTPAYMSPEQLLCNTASPASDVWSLAVVFARCLTGRLPFQELARRGPQALGNLPPLAPALDGVAEPLARVLAAALKMEASERPPSAGTFRAQLLAALSETSPGAWPNAASVGFAGDSALGLALSTVEAEQAVMNSQSPARGRPGSVLTQTLSQARSAWRRRSPAQRTLASAGVVMGLLVLADWGWALRARVSASVREHASAVSLDHATAALRPAASAAQPEVEPSLPGTALPDNIVQGSAVNVARVLGAAVPVAVTPGEAMLPSKAAPADTPAAKAPRSAHARRKRTRAKSTHRERAKKVVSVAATLAERALPAPPEGAGASPARPTMGANRSPILE